jgi:uncharacterized repeat protein (TIGR01451 family)
MRFHTILQEWLRRVSQRPRQRDAARWNTRPRLEVLEQRCLLTTWIVNSIGDQSDAAAGGQCDVDLTTPGEQCTLRAAIGLANSERVAGVVDEIHFNIGTGHQTISPSSPLPTIEDPVIIDGTTQSGFSGSPLIELNGSNAGNGADGLRITAGGSTVRGLVIGSFRGQGIEILTNGNNRIEGNFVGTDVTGNLDRGNTQQGLLIANAANNTVGGTTAGARNVISGNGFAGIEITRSNTGGSDTSGNHIAGNIIGLNAAGTADLGNSQHGVLVNGASGNTIGGTTNAERNIISGNSVGVQISQLRATSNVVLGNYIGTDITGTADLGNSGHGVSLLSATTGNTIGGTTAAARNVIAGNGSAGVNLGSQADRNVVQGNHIGLSPNGAALGNDRMGIEIATSNNTIGGVTAGAGNSIAFNNSYGVIVRNTTGNAIWGNSIFSNGTGTELGIELGTSGPAPNDELNLDADTGSNGLQNYPVISLATAAPGNTAIEGVLRSAANTTYRIEFFASPQCNAAAPNDFGEGQRFLGAVSRTTGPNNGEPNGQATFTGTGAVNLPVTLSGVNFLTATATDPLNNTSEFSRCFEVNGVPPTNPPEAMNDAPPAIDEDPGPLNLLVIPVLGNDTDPENDIDPTSVTITSDPSNGTAQVDPVTGDVTYEPAANFNGSDAFSYQVCDAALNCDNATVSITVNPVNDAPSFTRGPDQRVTNERKVTVAMWATNITAGPADEINQLLSFDPRSDRRELFEAGGHPMIDPAGTLTFTPAMDAIGQTTVCVVLFDDGGTARGGIDESAEQCFSIDIIAPPPLNQPPSFDPIADVTVTESSGRSNITITAISAGPGEDVDQFVEMTITSNNPSLFRTLDIPDRLVDSVTRQMTLEPQPGVCGRAIVTVKAEDDGGTATGNRLSVTRDFDFAVACVNDPPTATDGTYQLVGTGIHFIDLADYVGPDETADANMQFVIESGPINGGFSSPLGANGQTYFYTPPANFSGFDRFTYSVTDRGAPDGCTGVPPDCAPLLTSPVRSVTILPFTPAPPDLNVTLSGSPTPAVRNRDLTIRATVTNSQATADGVQLEILLPRESRQRGELVPLVRFVRLGGPNGGTCTTSSLGPLFPIVCDLGTVAASDAPREIDVIVQPLRGTGCFTTTATVSSLQTDDESTTLRTCVGIPVADLELTLTGPAGRVSVGDEVEYRVQVQNHGGSDANNLNVAMELPFEMVRVQRGQPRTRRALGERIEAPPNCTDPTLLSQFTQFNCSEAQLVFDNSVEYTIVVRALPGASGKPFCFAASVTADELDFTPSNESARTCTTVKPQADLAVTMTGPAGPVKANLPVEYRIQVTNNGPGVAEHVLLTDVVPVGAMLVSVSPNRGCTEVNAGQMICDIGSLAAGSTYNLALTLTPTTLGTIRNQLSAAVDLALNSPDPTPGNNVAAVDTILNGFELIRDGRADIRNGSPWATQALDGALDLGRTERGGNSHSARGFLELRGSRPDDSRGAIFQTVAIPANVTSVELTFWLEIDTSETSAFAEDELFVEIRDAQLNPVEIEDFDNTDVDEYLDYRLVGPIDLSAYRGQTVTLVFLGDFDATQMTEFRIDDVSICAM